MRIRTTETSEIAFQRELFERAGIGELQGLTMTADWRPTAGVEAVDFDSGEPLDVRRAFSDAELMRRWLFARALEVPFYVIASVRNAPRSPVVFHIFEICGDSGRIATRLYCRPVDEREFIRFWKTLKGTPQTKPLPDAGRRIRRSRVDVALARAGLSWGGNVDGFVLNGSRVKAIIECRRTTKQALERYDPNRYFRLKRGGDFNTWYPLTVVAAHLNVPLLLLTFRTGEERCGCAIVDAIDRAGLTYRNDIRPNAHLCGMEQALGVLERLRRTGGT